MKHVTIAIALLLCATNSYAQDARMMTYEQILDAYPQARAMQIRTGTARVYADAAANARTVATYVRNEQILAYEQVGSYYKVALPGLGHVGYMQTAQVEPVANEPAAEPLKSREPAPGPVRPAPSAPSPIVTDANVRVVHVQPAHPMRPAESPVAVPQATPIRVTVGPPEGARAVPDVHQVSIPRADTPDVMLPPSVSEDPSLLEYALLPGTSSGVAPASTTVEATPAGTSNTRKLFLQAHYDGHGVAPKGEDFEAGQGIGLKVGYGISRRVTLYVGADGAIMQTSDPVLRGQAGDKHGLAYVEVGGHLHFGAERRALVPYVDVALSGHAALYDVNDSPMTWQGVGASLGGGVKYFVWRVLALDLSVDASAVNYFRRNYGGTVQTLDLSATSARFNLGVSWYPFP